MTRPTCRDCRFWSRSPAPDDATGGECRRHAPVATADRAIWPTTASNAWCGDFRPAPPEAIACPADPATFADALRAEMRAAGIDRAALAAALGVTPQGVGKWLRGHGVAEPNRRALVAMFPRLRGYEP